MHWVALPSPVIEWDGEPSMRFIEVGGVYRFGDQYFAMLGDYATDHCGMFTFVANDPGGPYRQSARNSELLRNRSRMHVYFSRFFDGPDGALVTHHALAEGQFSDPQFVVYCSPFKRAVVEEGTLYLKWWDGNERIKGKETVLESQAGNRISYPAEQGIVLEGQMRLPAKLEILSTAGEKVVLAVDAAGAVEIGKVDREGKWLREEWADRQISPGLAPRFRLLLHKTMLEFYLEDYLMQCYSMLQPPAGQLSLENVLDARLWLWRDGLSG